MDSRIKVMVVDDHAIVREGLKSLLELDNRLTVVGEASSSMECLEKLPTHRPDVVLLDLKMPGVNGIEATRLIKESYPFIKVIVLTNYDDEEYVVESIKAGADGFVLKNVKKGDFIQIVHSVLQNQAFIDPAVTRKIFHQLKTAKIRDREDLTRPTLSQRELQILTHLVDGRSNKEIADMICLSPDTVKTHLKNIYHKLGAHNRSQASKIAIQEGLVHLPR